jgi:hypothetical protein
LEKIKYKIGVMMERYKNLGGDSGVEAYDLTTDSIKVEFSDGAVYLYTYASAGHQNIEHMKKLAVNGQGLNSFINTTVRKQYNSQIR